jgi:hypothetical protein
MSALKTIIVGDLIVYWAPAVLILAGFEFFEFIYVLWWFFVFMFAFIAAAWKDDLINHRPKLQRQMAKFQNSKYVHYLVGSSTMEAVMMYVLGQPKLAIAYLTTAYAYIFIKYSSAKRLGIIA